MVMLILAPYLFMSQYTLSISCQSNLNES